jgi:hypothetical protein
MENAPVPQKKVGWLRKLPLWKTALLLVVALFVCMFVMALFSSFGSKGGITADTPEAKQLMASVEAMDGWRGFGAKMMARGAAGGGERSRKALEQAPAIGAPEVVPAALTSTPAIQFETWGRQLILNADIALEVRDVRAAYDRVQIVAAAQGALITSANLQAGASEKATNTYGSASLVLRMPQTRFYAVRQRLIDLAGDLQGKVLRDAVSSEDVTEQYVDLQARLRHFKSQETQLLDIMSRARKISDILAVRDQLSVIQQEIERLSGQLRFLQNRVDLSTITVEITQKGRKPAPPAPLTMLTSIKDAGKQVSAAWTKALHDTISVFGFIAVAVVYLLPFAVILGLIWAVYRATRKKASSKQTV